MKALAFGLIAAATVALSASSASAQIVYGGSGHRVVVSPGFGGGFGGYAQPGLGYGTSLYNPGFGSSLYSPGFGRSLYTPPVVVSGYRHPSFGFGHYDYIPGHLDRHGNHYHYHPGHLHYHAPGTRSPRH